MEMNRLELSDRQGDEPEPEEDVVRGGGPDDARPWHPNDADEKSKDEDDSTIRRPVKN